MVATRGRKWEGGVEDEDLVLFKYGQPPVAVMLI
jgi:hypothetical protein